MHGGETQYRSTTVSCGDSSFLSRRFSCHLTGARAPRAPPALSQPNPCLCHLSLLPTLSFVGRCRSVRRCLILSFPFPASSRA